MRTAPPLDALCAALVLGASVMVKTGVEGEAMGRLDGKVALDNRRGQRNGTGHLNPASAQQRKARRWSPATSTRRAAKRRLRNVARSAGGRAVFQRLDVTSAADIQGAVARAVAEFGKLNVIFNTAGLGGAVGTIEETTVENWDRTQAVLLRAVFLGMKHAIPEIRKAGGGSIISTASIAGLQGGAEAGFLQRRQGRRDQSHALGGARSRQGHGFASTVSVRVESIPR